MKLSIIIINWNSALFLRKCLASVYLNAPSVSFEVLVVDNASYDGCAEMVQSEFPEVRFFQSEENLGFGRANNFAVERSLGAALLFLNSDTEVIGPAVSRLLGCLRSRPNAGAVGAKLLNPDATVQESCIQSFPSSTRY